MTDFTKPLEPYFEIQSGSTRPPLLQNAIIELKKRRYRADRWFKRDSHCYVFTDITIGYPPTPSFAAKPSQVFEGINANKITIIKNGTEQFFED